MADRQGYSLISRMAYKKWRGMRRKYPRKIFTKEFWQSGYVFSDTWHDIQRKTMCSMFGCKIEFIKKYMTDVCVRCHRSKT
jgi:hypothetical protein